MLGTCRSNDKQVGVVRDDGVATKDKPTCVARRSEGLAVEPGLICRWICPSIQVELQILREPVPWYAHHAAIPSRPRVACQIAAMPLLLQDRVIGAVLVAGQLENVAHRLGDHHVRVLAAIGRQLSLAVDRAQLCRVGRVVPHRAYVLQ